MAQKGSDSLEKQGNLKRIAGGVCNGFRIQVLPPVESAMELATVLVCPPWTWPAIWGALAGGAEEPEVAEAIAVLMAVALPPDETACDFR